MSERQYRILVIDDNPEDRHTYGRFLTKYCPDEYAVLEASSGQDGLRLCRSGQPHCVLLDYRLPDRNGLELLNELAHENGNLARAVIMLTGQGDEALAVQAMKAGAQDYLIKGRINADVLGRAIQNAIGKMALLRQIEEQRRELERLATTDSLTGLCNRRRFFEKLNEELARLRRYGGALSILLVDLDRFKNINDTYGHLVGDRVLAEVGQTLRSGLRETDFAARFGGEEFAVLAIGTDLQGAEELALRLRLLVAEQPRCSSGHEPFRITCSIGVAQLNDRMHGGQDLLAAADAALYEAKRAGRNCVRRADRSETGLAQ